MNKFLLAAILTTGAWAQDISAMYNQYVNQQNAYFQQLTQGVVQQNMSNPGIQQLYWQYRQQGGTASFEQFCYSYAATAGFTPDGIQRYQQSEAGIAAQQRQAWSQYQQAQAERAQAQSQWANGYYLNQQQAGYTMQGQASYSNGQYLPYTWQPGTSHGNYTVDSTGQYYQVNDGWATPIYQTR